jgi:hypothetical protein
LYTPLSFSDTTQQNTAYIPQTISAGSYTNCDLTVNSQGQITSISNGSGGGSSNAFYFVPSYTIVTGLPSRYSYYYCNNIVFPAGGVIALAIPTGLATNNIINFVISTFSGGTFELGLTSGYVFYNLSDNSTNQY